MGSGGSRSVTEVTERSTETLEFRTDTKDENDGIDALDGARGRHQTPSQRRESKQRFRYGNIRKNATIGSSVAMKMVRQHTDMKKEWIHDSYLIHMDDNSVLGSGATSTVRKITHKITGVVYALKTLQINRMKLSEVAVLLKEVGIMKQLDHPNIIRIIETFHTPSQLHIVCHTLDIARRVILFLDDAPSSTIFFTRVMELCTGGELFDRLYEQRNLHYEEDAARMLMQKMMSALKYLHAAGIAHRDLKLENFIFVSNEPDAEIKMIDFGFSHDRACTHMSEVVGTMYYIAPEVLNGDYTKQCDVWSMGVILYMLLTGFAPFGGHDDAAIRHSVRYSRVKFDRKSAERLSDEAKELVMRMLDRVVRTRPTASEVLEHSWLACDNMAMEIEHAGGINETTTLATIKAHKTFNKLKRTALLAVATSLKDEDIAELRKVFQQMDTNHNGILSVSEFKAAMASHARRNIVDSGLARPRRASTINIAEIEAMFDGVNLDHTGGIKYSEFLASAIQEQQYLAEDAINEAFHKIDLDNSGTITMDELRELLGDTGVGDDELARIMEEVDYHADGTIDFEEFRKMMFDGENPLGVNNGPRRDLIHG